MEFEKIIAERPTKTVYKDNGKTIKLFVENYSKSDILNEAVNQAGNSVKNIHIKITDKAFSFGECELGIY